MTKAVERFTQGQRVFTRDGRFGQKSVEVLKTNRNGEVDVLLPPPYYSTAAFPRASLTTEKPTSILVEIEKGEE